MVGLRIRAMFKDDHFSCKPMRTKKQESRSQNFGGGTLKSAIIYVESFHPRFSNMTTCFFEKQGAGVIENEASLYWQWPP